MKKSKILAAMLITSVFLLYPFFHCHAAEQIAIYSVGEKDQAAWNLLKKYFDNKGYNVSIYEKTNTLERHLENVNRINKTKASLMLAMDFRVGENNDVFVAVSNAKKGKGKILTIEETPAQHIEDSMELAKYIASAFGKTVKELPLFPLLGVDIPALFLRMECSKEKTIEMLDKLNDSLQKYFKRGTKK